MAALTMLSVVCTPEEIDKLRRLYENNPGSHNLPARRLELWQCQGAGREICIHRPNDLLYLRLTLPDVTRYLQPVITEESEAE